MKPTILTCGVRGMEDTVHLAKGVPAPSNAALVARPSAPSPSWAER
jgi:uncharacterized protein (DUF849 family)